jgi:NTP pyrophosphatase (non-canonical NTP hydrolase)
MGDEKEAALKPLEEAAEVFGAWQVLEPFTSAPTLNPSYDPERLWPKEVENKKERLANEIADCIQACVNFADREGIDLVAALRRVESGNRARGRY